MGVQAAPPHYPDERNAASPACPSDLRGKRILLVEDEPLVAMEIESELSSAGCHIVGPAGTVARAMQLIADRPCDAALRSEEHTSELQSLMRKSYAVFCLTNKNTKSVQTSRHTT